MIDQQNEDSERRKAQAERVKGGRVSKQGGRRRSARRDQDQCHNGFVGAVTELQRTNLVTRSIVH